MLFARGIQEFIPLEQATDGLRGEVQDTVFMRRDRVPTITVQAAIGSDETPAAMHARLPGEIEAIKLPIGYRFEWGGEFEDSLDAQRSLAGQLPIAFVIMVLTSVFPGARKGDREVGEAGGAAELVGSVLHSW